MRALENLSAKPGKRRPEPPKRLSGVLDGDFHAREKRRVMRVVPSGTGVFRQ
jgi:hypothetical protein